VYHNGLGWQPSAVGEVSEVSENPLYFFSLIPLKQFSIAKRTREGRKRRGWDITDFTYTTYGMSVSLAVALSLSRTDNMLLA
jgi:hypothetical protein